MVAAIVAAVAAIWSGKQSRNVQRELHRDQVEVDKEARLQPMRLDAYQRFLKLLQGVDRPINVETRGSMSDPRAAMAWVDELNTALAKDAQARSGEARSCLAEIRLHASAPVYERAKTAAAALNDFALAWMGVIAEYMKDDGDPSEAMRKQVHPAQEALKVAADDFEAAVRAEQGVG